MSDNTPRKTRQGNLISYLGIKNLPPDSTSPPSPSPSSPPSSSSSDINLRKSSKRKLPEPVSPTLTKKVKKMSKEKKSPETSPSGEKTSDLETYKKEIKQLLSNHLASQDSQIKESLSSLQSQIKTITGLIT